MILFEQIVKIYKKLTFGIQRRIFITNLTIGLLFIILLSMVLYSFMNYSINSETRKYATALNAQICNSMDIYVEEMEEVLLTLSNDKSLPYLIDKRYIGTYDLFKAHKDFVENTNLYMFFKSYYSIYIFLTTQSKIISQNSLECVDYILPDKIKQMDIYKKVSQSKTDYVLLDSIEKITTHTKTGLFGKAIKLNNDPLNQDFIVISAEKSIFSRFLHGVSDESVDYILITSKNNELIYSSDESIPNEIKKNTKNRTNLGLLKSIKIKGTNYQITSMVSKKTGWNVISMINSNNINRNLLLMNIIAFIITITFVILLTIATYINSSKISVSIRSLSRIMHNAGKGNYTLMDKIASNDEASELSDNFNQMIKEIFKNQILKREAEIRALQQQINPHFLYNTLDIIGYFIMKGRNDEAYLLVEKLGDIFRYNIIREKEEYSKIENELNNLKNYLDIMSIRLKDKLEIKFELDNKIMDYRIIKFILQPLAENALNHAFINMEKGYIIIIRGYIIENDVVFEVEDNGCGMSAEKLDEIAKCLNDGFDDNYAAIAWGIGIRNIHHRLVLSFGEKYGIKIQSLENSGTKVIIRIPMIL